MAKIVTNPIRRTYRRLIRQVIKDLGKTVYVYPNPETYDCPQCLHDLVTGESKNISNPNFITPVVIFGETISPQPFTRGRCPVCKGKGHLSHYTPVIVQALVKWPIEDGDIENTPAGIEGSNLTRIKARSTYYQTVRDAEYFIVDGVRCELFQPPVIRGLGKQEEMVVAFLKASDPGHSVKER
jgi:hypothetical protein